GRSQLRRWSPAASWPKLHVIHCGVDRGFLEGPPTPPPARARLVCVGRLCEDKGQLLLVEAAARLAREGLDFEIVFVGDGALRPSMEEMIRTQGLGGKLIL